MSVTRIVHVVNRTLDPLEVHDDGIPWVIRPGYKFQPVLNEKGEPVLDEAGVPMGEIIGAGPNGDVLMEPLPYFAAERAKRQNPVMGTEDPYQADRFESLIAVPAWNEDYSYRPQSEAIERLDREQLPAQLQSVEVIAARGGRKPVKVRDPKTGRFKTVIPGAREMVRGEAIPVNPGLTTQALS